MVRALEREAYAEKSYFYCQDNDAPIPSLDRPSEGDLPATHGAEDRVSDNEDEGAAAEHVDTDTSGLSDIDEAELFGNTGFVSELCQNPFSHFGRHFGVRLDLFHPDLNVAFIMYLVSFRTH